MAEGLLKYREYTLRVIIDHPKVSFDDSLEESIPISDTEIANIVSGRVQSYWSKKCLMVPSTNFYCQMK